MPDVAGIFQNIVKEVSKVFKGHESIVKIATAAFLTGGHILIEDPPGLGKTVMAKGIAMAVGGKFKRIQFTSDMLPSDILGIQVYNEQKGEFVFHKGPIFSNIVLADEINRSTPRTQSALLEAMTEGRVSVENKTYSLPEPFCVIATQNPVELYGTYPLPESELDRFIVRLSVGYPDMDTEVEIIGAGGFDTVVEELVKPVVEQEDILRIQKVINTVDVSKKVLGYVVNLATEIRRDPMVQLGVSTRALIGLVRLARCWALIEKRDFVILEDVRRFIPYVFVHRIKLKDLPISSPDYYGQVMAFINEVLARVPLPV